MTARDAVAGSTRKANMALMHMQLKRLGKTIETYATKRGFAKEWAWSRGLVNNASWYNTTTVPEFLKMGAAVRIGPMLGRDT